MKMKICECKEITKTWDIGKVTHCSVCFGVVE